MVAGVESTATPEFLERYLRLDDEAAPLIDDAIRRLLANPGSPWARRNRVVGERGAAWLVVVPGPDGDHALCWDQPDPADPVQLLLLLTR